MTASSLDQRRGDVLRALVQMHVATGEPVGSAALARALNRTLSPATLRNLMADLERAGYLQHPHTSAGRMPTDEGYRYYVDSLDVPLPVSAAEADAIDGELSSADAAPGQVIVSASRILSRLSRHVAFVLAPDIAKSRFRHIDLVRLPAPRILVVMVSHSGIVTNKVIELDEDISQQELQTCANYLNAEFAGLSLTEIRERLMTLMQQERALFDSLIKRVVALGERAFTGEGEGEVVVEGASNILEQPELGDPARAQELLRTFEEKGRLLRILNACISGDGVRVLIGHELQEPQLRDVAVVTSGTSIEGEEGWAVGVMGSTRMEYAHSVALVDHVARALARALEEMRR
jgi:heat-inducible transcriptional repressor